MTNSASSARTRAPALAGDRPTLNGSFGLEGALEWAVRHSRFREFCPRPSKFRRGILRLQVGGLNPPEHT